MLQSIACDVARLFGIYSYVVVSIAAGSSSKVTVAISDLPGLVMVLPREILYFWNR
jgi:hypothetical protein